MSSSTILKRKYDLVDTITDIDVFNGTLAEIGEFLFHGLCSVDSAIINQTCSRFFPSLAGNDHNFKRVYQRLGILVWRSQFKCYELWPLNHKTIN